MNRTLRIGLLATGSALALMVAFEGSAAAQCFYNNTAGGVDNTGAHNCISYNNGAATTGNVVNEASGTLTPAGVYPATFPGTATGISVLEHGTTLIGNILNSGTINANQSGNVAGINIGEGRTAVTTSSNAGAVLNGSITNSGTITSPVGIWLGGNTSLFSTVTGSIINAVGGLINYTNAGINVSFGTVGGSITNAGTITGTGNAGIGVNYGATLGSSTTPGSGNIVNATGAKIVSGYLGISVNGNFSTNAVSLVTIAGSIINNGNITVPNVAADAGIVVDAAVVLGGVTNNGTISGGQGIAMFGATDHGISRGVSIAGNIVNQNQIIVSVTKGAVQGIALFAGAHTTTGPVIVGGSVVNSGTISVTGASGTASGILLQGAQVAGVTNTSTITVSGGTVNVGIKVAKSSSAASPVTSSIGGSIVNQGSITAGTGILVGGGSIVKGGIIDTGTINASADAINLTGEGAATAITIMGGTAAVTGNIVGNGLSAGDTLNFQIGAGNAFTYDSNFSAIQQVNVTSGTVVLNGNANSSSTLTVSGGTLMGTGTIATAMTVSGGAFAPGNGAPGSSMTITGSLAFLSGALYVVYLNPSTSSLASVTGTASLNGTVDANFASGSYVQKQYTILTTTGGLGGTKFANLIPIGLPPGFAANLSYNADDVFLNLTATMGLQQSGLTQNEMAVANAINKYFNTVGSLPPNFANLFNLTGTTLANALQQLDGEDATDAQLGAFQLMDEFLELMLGQGFGGGGVGAGGGGLGFAPDQETSLPPDVALAYDSILKAPPKQTFDQRWSAWSAGFGGTSITDGNPVAGSNNVTTTTYGYAGGLEYRFSPDTVAGFALAGGGLNWGLAQGLGTGRSDAFEAGVYGKRYFGPAYVSGALAFGNNWFTTNRTALGQQLTANFQGQSYGARFEGGYRYGLPVQNAVVGVTPYAAVQTQWFYAPTYSEIGPPGGFGLTYNANTANDTRSELGARFDDLTTLNGTPLILRARLAWAHDWTSGTGLNAAFETLPGSFFTVNGAAIPQNSALTSASAQWWFTPDWSFTAKFDGEFASTSQTYAGSGTLKYTW